MDSAFMDFNESIDRSEKTTVENRILTLRGTAISPKIDYNYGEDLLKISGRCSSKHLVKISRFILNIIRCHFQTSQKLYIRIYKIESHQLTFSKLIKFINTFIEKELPACRVYIDGFTSEATLRVINHS